jgi:hypothetical protein
MSGRHAGARQPARTTAGIAAFLALPLLALAGIVYLLVDVRTTKLEVLTGCAILTLASLTVFAVSWRQNRRFPWVAAAQVLVSPLIALGYLDRASYRYTLLYIPVLLAAGLLEWRSRRAAQRIPHMLA